MKLNRGDIYYITFPYTFDPKFPNGKSKFVLILQEGEYFAKYNTVEVLLITSNADNKDSRFVTNVEIPIGTTRLEKPSWIMCAQTYPVLKSLFEQQGVWCAGKLSAEMLDKVDDALYEGLCMGLQHEIDTQDSADD